MPLTHGKSQKAFVKNLKTELDAGKPMKQSLAISYAMKKRAKKMAHGGHVDCEHGGPEMCAMGCYDGGGSVQPAPSPSPSGYENAGQSLKTDKDNPVLKSIQAAFAEGGNVNYSGNPGNSKQNIKGVHGDMGGGMSKAGAHARSTQSSRTPEQQERGSKFSKAEHEQVLGEIQSMKKPNLYAEGGAVPCMHCGGLPEESAEQEGQGMLHEAHEDAHDNEVRNRGMFQDHKLVDRIMSKRQMLSEGGKIANRDQGVSTESGDQLADLDGNEFDDLALRDDLESSYTGANSGDDLGNDVEDQDRKDIVARILRSRAKKDRMPRPA